VQRRVHIADAKVWRSGIVPTWQQNAFDYTLLCCQKHPIMFSMVVGFMPLWLPFTQGSANHSKHTSKLAASQLPDQKRKCLTPRLHCCSITNLTLQAYHNVSNSVKQLGKTNAKNNNSNHSQQIVCRLEVSATLQANDHGGVV